MADTEVVEKNQLVAFAENTGLDKPRVVELIGKFGDPFKDALTIINHAKDISVTNENQTHEMEEAGNARKELKRLRVEVEKTRKSLKEQSLREGKAIDGMANIIKAIIVPEEEKLEQMEKIAENLAAARKAKLIAERKARLLEYVDQPSLYNYENMSDELFDELIEGLSQERAERIAAEEKAEAERIAAARAAEEEQKRIRLENEKLKAEAEAREAALAKERQEAEAKLAAERAEQEKVLAAERAKAEAERKAQEEALRIEREKREAIEAEQRAKEAEAARLKAEAEEKQRQSLLAPDKEKLMAFADVIDRLELPNVSNRDAGKLLDETKDFLDRISKNLRVKAKQL